MDGFVYIDGLPVDIDYEDFFETRDHCFAFANQLIHTSWFGKIKTIITTYQLQKRHDHNDIIIIVNEIIKFKEEYNIYISYTRNRLASYIF